VPRPHIEHGQDIRVLHSFKAPGSETTYAVQMTEGAPPEVSTLYFSWTRATLGRYDVLHLHWPEYLVRGKGRKDAALALVRMPLLFARLAVTRVAVVRTLHNVAPHEDGHFFERALLDRLDRRTDLAIRLNPVTDPAGTPVETILHGHYIDRFATHPKSEPETGHLLYFGLVRRYKGIERLIEVFDRLPSGFTLRIVGRPNLPALRESIERAVGRSPRMSARLEFVPDAALVAEIGRAELVVLPYKEMQNSGSLLVALSLGRPVLAPRSEVNESILSEVGPEWLHLYDGELTEDVLLGAVDTVRAQAPTRATTPRMLDRDWPAVGRRHYEAYLRALRIARG